MPILCPLDKTTLLYSKLYSKFANLKFWKTTFTITFEISLDAKMAQGLDSPEKYSKKMRTLIHKMFCKSCSNIPRLKPVKAQNTVSIKRLYVSIYIATEDDI